MESSRTRIGYSKGEAISNSNGVEILKWLLKVHIVQIISNVCICSTISIPFLVIIRDIAVLSNHGIS
jgi:hypothetical protein